jgi:hypothetical protein
VLKTFLDVPAQSPSSAAAAPAACHPSGAAP